MARIRKARNQNDEKLVNVKTIIMKNNSELVIWKLQIWGYMFTFRIDSSFRQ